MLRVAWSPEYNLGLPSDHRFPMIKYDLIKEQLLYEGLINTENLFTPELISTDDICLTHDRVFLSRLQNLQLSTQESRKIGFPLSKKLIDREFLITSGTVRCCDHALEYGVSLNVAGGTHHAFKGHGEGFCILNDQAVAANILLKRKLASKILIIDLDVHQGNGTAKLFEDESRVFTLSFHGASNYPFKKEVSDLDVAFDDGTDDELYLLVLNHALSEVINKFKPDFVFYQSGVDGLVNDKLGKLNLSILGLKKRDIMVIERCKYHSIPIVISMGGGYSTRLYDIVEAHSNTFRVVRDVYHF